MSTTPEEHAATQRSDESAEPESSAAPGVEVGFVEGEGTTFEPEEDPQAAGEG
jgi:hypothetical protein